MPSQGSVMYEFDLQSILKHAPPASGVYRIHSRDACLYIGESDDVCSGLLEIYYDANPCLAEKTLTHFAFELAPLATRGARRNAYVRALGPACNLRVGSPKCRYCRLGQGDDSGGLVRVASPF